MGRGHKDGEFNPAEIKVFGKKIALRKIDLFHDRQTEEGIIIPDMHDSDVRLNKATIISIGKEAQEDTGLNVGDLVLYDSFAVFHDTHPIVVLNAENVIWKLKEDTKYTTLDNIEPLRKNIMFKSLSAQDMQDKSAAIIIPDSIKAKATAMGKVLKWSPTCETSKYFEKGYEHIILSAGSITRVHTNNFIAELVNEDEVLGIF